MKSSPLARLLRAFTTRIIWHVWPSQYPIWRQGYRMLCLGNQPGKHYAIIVTAAFCIMGCQQESDSRVDLCANEFVTIPNYVTDLDISVWAKDDVDLNHIDLMYSTVQQCTGLYTTEAPFISIVEDIRPINDCMGVSHAAIGITFHRKGDVNKIIIQEGSDDYVYKHEMFHHLLFVHNRADESYAHEPAWLWQCQY